MSVPFQNLTLAKHQLDKKREKMNHRILHWWSLLKAKNQLRCSKNRDRHGDKGQNCWQIANLCFIRFCLLLDM